MLPLAIPGWLTAKVAGIIGLVVVVVGIYFYIGFLRSTIDTLETDNSILKSAVKTQQVAIDSMQKDFKKISELNQEYNNRIRELEKQSQELENTLYREKYGKDSLEDLILKDKKKRIEALINEATQRVMRCFELISGAKLLPNEKVECK